LSQSGYIAAALLAGFIFYLAAQNRLSVYAAVLWGNTSASLPSTGSTNSNSGKSGPSAAASNATSGLPSWLQSLGQFGAIFGGLGGL